jgi:hypothetical protein
MNYYNIRVNVTLWLGGLGGFNESEVSGVRRFNPFSMEREAKSPALACCENGHPEHILDRRAMSNSEVAVSSGRAPLEEKKGGRATRAWHNTVHLRLRGLAAAQFA